MSVSVYYSVSIWCSFIYTDPSKETIYWYLSYLLSYNERRLFVYFTIMLLNAKRLNSFLKVQVQVQSENIYTNLKYCFTIDCSVVMEKLRKWFYNQV